MSLRLQPISIAATDGDGVLVFSEKKLVAVFARLSELHEDAAGQWFLEAGFDLDRRKHLQFADLNAAQRLDTPICQGTLRPSADENAAKGKKLHTPEH